MVDDYHHRFGFGLGGGVVLVTGASSGIGRAVAERFAALGCRVAAADVDPIGLTRLADATPEIVTLPLDLGDEISCRKEVEETASRFGRLDILVNAGAVILHQDLEAVTDHDFERPMIRNGVSLDAIKQFVTMIPMGRVAQSRELADGCLFLASDWASYVTGQTLDVNGGQSMSDVMAALVYHPVLAA